jgi:hypothetical protein
MRRWRKMTWALVVWTVLMAVWIGGAAIGVKLLAVFWMLGFFVLALIWLRSRLRTPAVG